MVRISSTRPAPVLARIASASATGLLSAGLFLAGCGQSELPNAAEFRSPVTADSEVVRLNVIELDETISGNGNSGILQVAGAKAVHSEATVDGKLSFDRGTPEWLMIELAKLESAGKSGDEFPSQLEASERQRLTKMVELSTEVVSKTHNDAARQLLFNNAVHYLSDARLRLAIAGDQDQAQYLSREANALYERDASSFAAVESATKLLQLAQTQAERNVKGDPQWMTGFARQSRLFAERFPQETSRAAVNLVAAATLCDQAGQWNEARECVGLLQERFPETPFAEQTQGLRRRLDLPGKALTEFGGSTFDGGFVTVDQYRGKPLLIVFWASDSATFQADLVSIEKSLARYGDRVSVLGVNLDRDEQQVRSFLKQSGNTWTHIFFSSPDKRGERNVLAEYYGISRVPSYWLVDSHGIVRSIHLDVLRLDQHLGEANSPPKLN